jgi:hypothetical protein
MRRARLGAYNQKNQNRGFVSGTRGDLLIWIISLGSCHVTIAVYFEFLLGEKGLSISCSKTIRTWSHSFLFG